ncbi:MAG: 1-acyl-sn-glycerol-3-phosphate acyltransferase [Treponema sp.]|nr:1-acyl-sn-glycerol-3-phosphate acyltransferase [Treponema sp.]
MFPPDLPSVTNKPLYAYRVFAKWLSFFVFGFISLLFAFIFAPPMRLLIHPKEKFKKSARRLISFAMRLYVSFMHCLGIVNLEAGNKEKYRNLSSKIIVANHPSILDVVMLLSLIPNADCIVNAHLKGNIFITGVIRQLYIPNIFDYEDILQACVESLKQGNCMIIFPEGTRTPRSGKVIIRKGAARVAMASGCNIVPLHIGGTDKYGIGKNDPWTGFNPRERYIFTITMGAEISPLNYQELPSPKAVRALTKEMTRFLFPNIAINSLIPGGEGN